MNGLSPKEIEWLRALRWMTATQVMTLRDYGPADVTSRTQRVRPPAKYVESRVVESRPLPVNHQSSIINRQ